MLQPKDVETPQPGPHDVLVKTAACGVCYHDLLLRNGTMKRGVPFPLIVGHEPSGVVERVGSEVRSVAPGDRVAATQWTGNCGCVTCVAAAGSRCACSGSGTGMRSTARTPSTSSFRRRAWSKSPGGLAGRGVHVLVRHRHRMARRAGPGGVQARRDGAGDRGRRRAWGPHDSDCEALRGTGSSPLPGARRRQSGWRSWAPTR